MATGVITSERQGDILVVTLDHPPSNALSAQMRARLIAVLADTGNARAVVIRGAGAVFCSALRLDPGERRPTLSAVCLALQDCAIPVVAALHGAVIGPGAELALAAQARVARNDTRFALPDIAFGLPPEGGATQRLPRLVGPSEAIRILTTGGAVLADEGQTLGLYDEITQGDVAEAAINFALRLAEAPPRPRGLGDPITYQAAIATARRQWRDSLPAVGRIISCVEAALLLPMENGLAIEAVAYEDLEGSDEVAALRAAARAERRASALPPAVARAHPAPITCIGIVGSGPGLSSAALLALIQGFTLTWIAPDARAAEQTRASIDQRLEADLRIGRLVAADRDAARGRLSCGTDPSALEAAGLVIHALTPDASVLRHAPPGAPQLVLGGAPGELGLAIAPSGRLSELALPDEEPPEAIATAVAALRRMGVPPLLVGQRPVLGQRLAQAGYTALMRMVALGVPHRVISSALAAFGAPLPETQLPDSQGVLRAMSAEEVQLRWLGALVNEGLKLLDSGIARRPSDVDHCLVAGYQFPRWRGGPMHQADRIGLMVLRRDLRLWAAEDPFWTPGPLIDRLISDGLRLPVLDG